MENPVERRPHFFKIFFPCNSWKRLGIPQGFWKHIQPQTLGYASLTGPSGNVWNVGLVRDANGSVSFEKGWEEFVADHALGVGDFLVFRHDGDLNFTVLIFDPTSCEKEGTFDVSPCQEVKSQVKSLARRHAKEGFVSELITTDPETTLTFAPENMCVGEDDGVIACQAFSKQQSSSIERSHLEEGLQIVDGSLITYEVDLDRGGDPGMLEPQVGPSPLLTNAEPENFQIPANLNKCCEDDLMDNCGVDNSQTPHHFSHEKPPSSRDHALQEQCFLGLSDHVTHEIEEYQGEQGAPMLKHNGMNEIEVAEAPPPNKRKIWGKTRKHKKLAAKRSIQRKTTTSHIKGAVNQLCHEYSICSASSNVNNVKTRAQKRVESRRRPVTYYEKEKALEAAVLFQSKHPYCLCIMRDSYVYRGFFMYLPNYFTERLPKYSMKMKLWDHNNKSWGVAYRFFDRGGALSAGWGKFARAHNLETDDVCVFELIKPDEIRVHIFRAVEEITPPAWNTRRRKN